MDEYLRHIGLSEGEIRIYETLIENGPSPLNAIHERVGIERRNIYDILNKLIERGMVSYITENRRRVFHAAHPSKIISYIEEKEDDLARTKEEVRKHIPDLAQKFSAAQPSINAEVFRGIDGVKAVWEDTLTAKESFWIGSGNYIPNTYPHFYTYWSKKRIALRAKRHHLYRSEIRGKVIENKYEDHRFLPTEFSANPVVTCIYGSKVAHMMLGAELFVFVIESKEVSDNQRAYFKYLWDKVARR